MDVDKNGRWLGVRPGGSVVPYMTPGGRAEGGGAEFGKNESRVGVLRSGAGEGGPECLGSTKKRR